MQIHGRAKLGPAGRLALTQAVTGGMTLKRAAACFNVSPASARWEPEPRDGGGAGYPLRYVNSGRHRQRARTPGNTGLADGFHPSPSSPRRA